MKLKSNITNNLYLNNRQAKIRFQAIISWILFMHPISSTVQYDVENEMNQSNLRQPSLRGVQKSHTLAIVL